MGNFEKSKKSCSICHDRLGAKRHARIGYRNIL